MGSKKENSDKIIMKLNCGEVIIIDSSEYCTILFFEFL